MKSGSGRVCVPNLRREPPAVCFPIRCSLICIGLFGSAPSIPGPLIGEVMVLQAFDCLSDREAIQWLEAVI